MFPNKSFSSNVTSTLSEMEDERRFYGTSATHDHVVRSEAVEPSALLRGWVLMDEEGENLQSVGIATTSSQSLTASPSCKRSLELYSLLLHEKVDLDRLRKLAWHGVPMGIRGTVWKLLLGYLPPDRRMHEYTYAHRRNLYADLVRKHYRDHQAHMDAIHAGSHSPSAGDETELVYKPQCACFQAEDRATFNQIMLDVPRTTPRGLNKGLHRSPAMYNMLVRLLYIWTKENPDVGYVQGLNELPVQFILVFLAEYIDQPLEDLNTIDLSEGILNEVEADAFWGLSLMMSKMGGHLKHFTEGMTHMVARLSELLRIRDNALYTHMQQQGCDLIVVALRWMICILTREFTYDLSLRLWDSYLSHGSGWVEFHVYVCAAFLTTPKWSEALCGMEFSEMVVFLQQPPTHEWGASEIEDLLVRAYEIRLIERGERMVVDGLVVDRHDLAGEMRKMDVLNVSNNVSDQSEPETQSESFSTKAIQKSQHRGARTPLSRAQSNDMLEFFRSLSEPHIISSLTASPLSDDIIDELLRLGYGPVLKDCAGASLLRGPIARQALLAHDPIEAMLGAVVAQIVLLALEYFTVVAAGVILVIDTQLKL